MCIRDRKAGDEIIGNRTKVKIVKNKLAPPFREAEFDIIYGEGISRESELIELGTKAEILEKTGTWYSWKGHRLGQGRENAKIFLKENPKIKESIENQVREYFGLNKVIQKEEKIAGKKATNDRKSN